MASLLTEMGLQIWDAPGDYFSYSDLASNFTKINNHDHTAGKGVPLGASTVGTGQLQDNAVSGPKIQDGAVTATKLGAGAGKYTSGLFAARPTATTAGLGANYYATDTKQLFWSDGTTWQELSTGGQRYKSIVNTAENVTSATHILATTPDRISNIVIPTADSLLFIGFSVRMRALTTLGVGGVRLTLNGATVEDVTANGSPQITVATGYGTSTTSDDRIVSDGAITTGMRNAGLTNGGTSDTTTNMVAYGTALPLRMQPGTHTLELRYKSDGTAAVSVRNRRMWAWVQSF